MTDQVETDQVDETGAVLAKNYRNADVEWSPAYLGGFLNWGYWKDVPKDRLFTPGDRVRASADLYRLVLRTLDVDARDTVLEVGCGMGAGAIAMYCEFGLAELHGIDVLEAQVDFAVKVSSELPPEAREGLFFTQGSASQIPYPDQRFSKVYSVEAVQHFPDISGFATEVHRVLNNGGKLGITTFFPSTTATIAELAAMLQSYRTGFDVVTTVDDLAAALGNAGFVDFSATSIGEQVWRPLDEWIVANGYQHHWGRNFLKAHEQGLLDYYLVTASKSGTP